MGLRTFKPTRPASRYGSPLAKPLMSLVLLALAGCQGMYLHQPDRAATASTAKKSIELVDIDAITKTENDNLAAMLKQEVKGIEKRSSLLASLALIQISSSEQSVATHYSHSMAKIKEMYGAENIQQLKDAGDCKISGAGARQASEDLRNILLSYGLKSIPACKTGMTPTINPPAGFPPDALPDFNQTYAEYTKNCAAQALVCFGVNSSSDLDMMRNQIKERQDKARQLKSEIAITREAYASAVALNKTQTDEAGTTATDIKTKAYELNELVEKLSSYSPSAAQRLRATALVELLGSAASGEANKDGANPSSATVIAATLPSISQSLADIKASSGQVPVAHLLLALNNVIIAGERDDRLAALDVEQLGFLQRQYDNREQQTRLWRLYSDGLCNMAIAANGQSPRNKACSKIEFTESTQQCDITLSDGTKLPIKNCVLGRSWRSLFRDGLTEQMTGLKVDARRVEARRALYEAAAAYLQVRLIALKPAAEEFNKIDADYRGSVIKKEAVLEQWKNVVTIPAGELEGYYSGGVKPEDIADLLIKAVGFTAVAIGVSK